MFVFEKYKALLKDRFLLNVTKLTITTLLAQVISLLSLTFLTRLYSADAFGVLSLYMAALSIATVVSTLHFEVSITAPKSDSDAVNLFFLCLGLIFLTAWALSIWVGFFPSSFVNLFKIQPLEPYLWALPFGLIFVGFYNVSSYFCIRKQAYGAIAGARIVQSISQAIVQIVAGLFHAGPIGLLLGDVACQSAGSSRLFVKQAFPVINQNWSLVSWERIKSLAAIYKKFPYFGFPSELIITFGTSLPLIFIGKGWGVEALGYYMVALRISEVPLSLLGRSIGKVYLGEAMSCYNQSIGELRALFWRTSLQLGVIGIVIVPLASFGFYFISPYIFGQKWETSGLYCVLLIPLALSRFIVSPILQISSVIQKQNIELVISIIRVIAIVVLFELADRRDWPFVNVLVSYSILSAIIHAVFYLTFVVLVLKDKGKTTAE